MKRAWLVAALSSMIFACVGDGFQTDYKDPMDTENCRASDIRTIYADTDMDGYGDPNTGVDGCVTPVGFVDVAGDCDDSQPLVYTGATDMCGDKLDNDCSGADVCLPALAGHWSFAETTGEIAGDESGHLLTGTLLGGLLNTASNSLTFDGATTYVEIQDSELFQMGAATISMWIMPTTLGVEQAVFSKDSNGADAGGHLTIYFDANGSVRARLQDNQNNDYEVASIPMPLNQWHHIAFTFGGNEGMTLYIDDIVAGKNPYTGALIRNEEPLVIGASTDNSGNLTATPINKVFEGQIAQVQFYDRQLLRTELTSLKLVSDPRL